MASSNQIEWSILKGPITVFLCSLALSTSLVGGTWYFMDEMNQKYLVKKKQFQTISNQYLSVDQEEKLVKQYLPEFIDLYRTGLLGEEQRLNWIETLEDTSQEIKLLGMRYEIDSQIPFTPRYPLNTGIYKLFTSPMKLTLDLLHMGDLQKLFNKLSSNVLGVYNISKCKFNRKGGESEFELEIKPNISVECNLEWFNLKRSDGSIISLTTS